MLARHRRETRPPVRLRCGSESRPARIVGWQVREDALQHPGTAQVQSIEMRQLGIARVR